MYGSTEKSPIPGRGKILLLQSKGQIGIEENLAIPPLPHHHTYWSVRGGSCRFKLLNRAAGSKVKFGRRRIRQDYGQSASGLYLPAVQRYKGTLYSNAPALSSRSDRDSQILILSAPYGPLHPLSRIQDYNLQMSDKPAYGTWKKRLPSFLRNYALLNGIREVHLFFGSSTYYLKAAQATVEPLLKEKLIKKAIQYHVVGGSTRLTPQTHGELLEDFLKRGSIDKLPGNVEERPL